MMMVQASLSTASRRRPAKQQRDEEDEEEIESKGAHHNVQPHTTPAAPKQDIHRTGGNRLIHVGDIDGRALTNLSCLLAKDHPNRFTAIALSPTARQPAAGPVVVKKPRLHPALLSSPPTTGLKPSKTRKHALSLPPHGGLRAQLGPPPSQAFVQRTPTHGPPSLSL